jgi:hypothetical protein
LEPILILGRYGLGNENSKQLSNFGKWAESKGVKVMVWPKLLFQDQVNLTEYMDIPQMIENMDCGMMILIVSAKITSYILIQMLFSQIQSLRLI